MAFQEKIIDFDGSDDYVTMGNVLGFEYSDPFSLSCWVKTDATSGYLISKRLGLPNYTGYGLTLAPSGGFEFSICNTLSTAEVLVRSVVSIADRAWHHITGTYDGSGTASGITLYVDGVAVSTTTESDTLSSSSIINSASLNIGARTNSSIFLDGKVGEVAVYDKELSSVEVNWMYNGGLPRDLAGGGAPSNLVGWWRMGNGDTYPTLTDNSVNSNNGTMTNMSSGDIETYWIGGYPAFYAPSTGTATSDESVFDGFISVTGAGAIVTTRHKMRAVDDGAPPPGFVVWTVTGVEPDFAGVYFSTGTPTPIGSMVPGSAVELASWDE